MKFIDIIEKLKYWAKDPEHLAIVSTQGEKMSFRELEERSRAFAHYLLKHYAGNKAPVAVFGDKENDMLTGILGALRAGHPYVVISSYYPQERISQILKIAKPVLVFAASGKAFDPLSYPVLLAKQSEMYEAYAHEPLDDTYCVKGEDPACIVFTSGSTGIPKGVIVAAEGIASMVTWRKNEDGAYPEHMRIADMTPYSFSSSFVFIFLFLIICGATLYAIDKALLANFAELVTFVIDSDSHLLGGTPSFLDILLKNPLFCEENTKSLLYFKTGGEAMTAGTAKALKERFPQVSVWNIWGASETSAGGIMCEYTNEIIERDYLLPTGYPAQNAEIYLADENGEPVPDGEEGECIIISDMVALGYLNDKEKEKEVFFKTEDGRRGYRTHDIMVKRSGMYYYVGRSDNLIKVGGNRVEAEEVERAIMRGGDAAGCVVVPAEKDGKAQLMVAYIAMKEPVTKQLQMIMQIKKRLKELLPAYMIPQKIVFVDAIPKNANGKVDRKLLKQMASLDK
ncbi:MAG: AMP-binding protein [Christensenellaceae bacterium]|nr:AMP-binding protein [Christensenellaceae bacterium]